MLDTKQPGVEKFMIFDNHFTRNLPGDPELQNFRRQVPGACFSRVLPTKVRNPELVAYSKQAAALLGFSDDFCRSDEFVQIFAGNRVVNGMDPHAMCYGGHQFGSWAGQLGDGRAINLGEVVNPGEQRWTLQLKGAGPTPYSRSADGLAVLRSSIREFLCSEAMYHLGVETTRALSIVTTGEHVERDMFYDGHPKMEPGAIVCRAARSFLRFGNYEVFAARNEIDNLKQVVDYTIETLSPHLGPPSTSVYVKWFRQVCETTLKMILDWMRVGFVHGVMNTDNMSILGLTIDYGPYGWLEDYDPVWTPNTTDAQTRRYSFGNQPGIAQWNLAQLANAIFPLIKQVDPLQEAVTDFGNQYQKQSYEMVAGKLGINPDDSSAYRSVINSLPNLLKAVETDYIIFFRKLAQMDVKVFEKDPDSVSRVKTVLDEAFYRPEQRTPQYEGMLEEWLKNYLSIVVDEGKSCEDRVDGMDQVNPKYVLRNYMAQLAIDAAEKGDFALVNELLELSQHPYDEQPEMGKWAVKRPDWARNRPGCSMLSCSS